MERSQPPFGNNGECSRRAFLGWAAAAGAAVCGGSRGSFAASDIGRRSVILINLTGGASQLETFDPKPDAPDGIRGPFGSIATRIAGIRINEYLPGIASRLDKLTLIRSVHHADAPIHEAGLQWLETGALSRAESAPPHFGAVAARRFGAGGPAPPFVVLNGPIASLGSGIAPTQTAGSLGPAFEPFCVAAAPGGPGYDPRDLAIRSRLFIEQSAALDENPLKLGSTRGYPRSANAFDCSLELGADASTYGESEFARRCLLARKLIEADVRVVVINMFNDILRESSWDCHGRRPFGGLADYATTHLASLDSGLSGLYDDLSVRGLLSSTMVVATGEFGRTPRLNTHGGRDHWTGAWSALVAGGPLRPGEVIGKTDRRAGEPIDSPLHVKDLHALILDWLGLSSVQSSLKLARHARNSGATS